MFTKNCFIQKCNETLINKLIKLGYKPIGNINYNTYGIYCHNGKFKTCSTNEQPSIKNQNFIQCYENENLFLAIAALRNDKPDYQWFIWDDIKDACDKFKQYIPSELWQEWWWFEVHKASVEELIEHFKMRKNEE